jgi:hypothetical protein
MRNTLSKGPDWHSTRQISYTTVMSDFRHIDGKLGIVSFMKVIALYIRFS